MEDTRVSSFEEEPGVSGVDVLMFVDDHASHFRIRCGSLDWNSASKWSQAQSVSALGSCGSVQGRRGERPCFSWIMRMFRSCMFHGRGIFFKAFCSSRDIFLVHFPDGGFLVYPWPRRSWLTRHLQVRLRIMAQPWSTGCGIGSRDSRADIRARWRDRVPAISLM